MISLFQTSGTIAICSGIVMQTLSSRTGNMPKMPAWLIRKSQYVSKIKFITIPMIRAGITASFMLTVLSESGIFFLCKKKPQQIPVRNAENVSPGKGGYGENSEAPMKSDAA